MMVRRWYDYNDRESALNQHPAFDDDAGVDAVVDERMDDY